jgi:Family of unknown function (DUF6314)
MRQDGVGYDDAALAAPRRWLISLPALFSGTWRLDRHIRDRRAGGFGTLRGVARFTPDDTMLRYEENGVLALGEFRSEARRDYRFRIEGPAAFSVFFADGGFFHRADLEDGRAVVRHDCAPDDYRGRYRIFGPDSWLLTWQVRGPRKDMLISTRFSR